MLVRTYQVVSEHFDLEMGPPTIAQRVELIEEKLTDLEVTVKEMVTNTGDGGDAEVTNRGVDGGAKYGH